MPKIWRLNIKTAAVTGVDARAFCLSRNLLGIGWPIDCEPAPPWEAYEKVARAVYYEKGDRGWWPAINVIKNRMSLNDLCWTRDWTGIYYLGRITSAWRYEAGSEFQSADVVNVRDCEWLRVGAVDAVPGKVLNSFIPPRTVQEICDDTVSLFSQFLHNSRTPSEFRYPLPCTSLDLFSLLSAEDCEDLVALYVQVQGYVLVPSSRRSDTAAYEFVLRHRTTGEAALVQVKNGYVDLNIGDYEKLPGQVFLFTTKGSYLGESRENVHCLSVDEVNRFIKEHVQLLPDRIKVWREIARELGNYSAGSGPLGG